MSVTVFLVVLVLATAIGLTLYGRLLAQLQHRHAASWTALGRPELTPWHLIGNIADGRSMRRFLWQNEFEDLDDEELTRRCTLFKWYLVLYIFALPVVLLIGTR